MCDEKKSNSFLPGVVFGAIIGAGLYYFLTATEKGKEVQKQLKEKGEDALDNLEELVDEIENKGEEFREKAIEVQEKLADKIGETKIDQLRERGQKAIRFFKKNGKSLV